LGRARSEAASKGASWEYVCESCGEDRSALHPLWGAFRLRESEGIMAVEATVLGRHRREPSHSPLLRRPVYVWFPVAKAYRSTRWTHIARVSRQARSSLPRETVSMRPYWLMPHSAHWNRRPWSVLDQARSVLPVEVGAMHRQLPHRERSRSVIATCWQSILWASALIFFRCASGTSIILDRRESATKLGHFGCLARYKTTGSFHLKLWCGRWVRTYESKGVDRRIYNFGTVDVLDTYRHNTRGANHSGHCRLGCAVVQT
jgi:hypothetical protein